MITGDNRYVNKIATKLELHMSYAKLPEEKYKYVEELKDQGKIYDGRRRINDAPALAIQTLVSPWDPVRMYP